MGSPPEVLVAAAERRARVVEMRRSRVTFETIAKELGVSETRARQIYREALNAIQAPGVEEHRTEQRELIDKAIADLLLLTEDHDRPRTVIEAWNSIRMWLDRESKLLGLDMPTKVEATVDATVTEVTQADIEFSALLREAKVREQAREAALKSGDTTP